MTRKLPEGTASISFRTIAYGSSSSGMKCSTASSKTATGLLKSSVLAAADRIVSVSRRSASM
jgi:hypothetical protein